METNSPFVALVLDKRWCGWNAKTTRNIITLHSVIRSLTVKSRLRHILSYHYGGVGSVAEKQHHAVL